MKRWIGAGRITAASKPGLLTLGLATLGLTMLSLMLSLMACSSNKSEGVAPASPSYSGSSLPTPADAPVPVEAGATPVAAPATFDKQLVGTLGQDIEIQMELRRDGDKLFGSYFYETVRKPLELSGVIANDGNATLIESTQGGAESGKFTGKLFGEELAGDVQLRFAGNWAKPNGEGALPFALREKRFDIGGGRKFVTKTIEEENKKERYELEASYPQIEGLGEAGFANFNRLVTTQINKRVADFRKAAPEAFDKDNPEAPSSGFGISYDITLATADFVSIFFDVYSYSSGAAHPNSFSWTLNYDLKNDRELKLRDLFQPDARYLSVISRLSINTLTRHLGEMADNQWLANGAAPKAENFQNWNITRKGLLFTFDPYQVAPYAAGPQEVLIPFASLKELLRPDSPIAALIGTGVLPDGKQ